MEQRCPDCGVTMEETTLEGYGTLQLVTDEQAEGLSGSLGVHKRHDVESRTCPECGLVRLYADLEAPSSGGGDDGTWLYGTGLFW